MATKKSRKGKRKTRRGGLFKGMFPSNPNNSNIRNTLYERPENKPIATKKGLFNWLTSTDKQDKQFIKDNFFPINILSEYNKFFNYKKNKIFYVVRGNRFYSGTIVRKNNVFYLHNESGHLKLEDTDIVFSPKKTSYTDRPLDQNQQAIIDKLENLTSKRNDVSTQDEYYQISENFVENQVPENEKTTSASVVGKSYIW